jgi:hypothetical protein
MLPVRKKRRTREGGAARESKNETREKGTARSRRNAREKHGDLLRQNGTHLPAPTAGKTVPMSLSGRERILKRKIYRNRPIICQKAQITKARGVRAGLLVQSSTISELLPMVATDQLEGMSVGIAEVETLVVFSPVDTAFNGNTVLGEVHLPLTYLCCLDGESDMHGAGAIVRRKDASRQLLLASARPFL